MLKPEQTRNNIDEDKPKRDYCCKDWVGNIVKDLESNQTEAQYWASVRSEILPEYLELYDKTETPKIKKILRESSKCIPEFRFQISIYDFEELKETDFLDLLQYTDILKLRVCDAGKLLKDILYKKEVEHYAVEFKLTEQTIHDIFNDNWTVGFYTIQIVSPYTKKTTPPPVQVSTNTPTVRVRKKNTV